MTKRTASVISKVRNFQAAIAKIQADPDLSTEGKERRITAIVAEAARYRVAALADIRADFAELRQQDKLLTTQRKQAEESAAAAWDYTRLNYESTVARAAIISARTVEEAQNLYQAAASSGNREKARAWAEAAQDVVISRFGQSHGLEADKLTRQMQKDAASLTTPPELAELKTQRDELISGAINLQHGAQEIGEYYDSHHWTNSEFGREYQTVNIERIFNQARSGWDYSMTVSDPPEPREDEAYQAQFTRLIG